jgi:hypothetical protein
LADLSRIQRIVGRLLPSSIHPQAGIVIIRKKKLFVFIFSLFKDVLYVFADLRFSAFTLRQE